MKFLTFVTNVDWTKLWWILGILGTFWAGLTGLTLIYPAFDTPFKIVNFVLGALVAACLFAARGGKYVADRTQSPPQDGKP